MSREAADICRRAAEIQQERGHCKGDLSDTQGRVCMWGALREAMTLDVWHDCWFDGGLRGEISEVIRSKGLDRRRGAFPGADWNDAADTTEKDVAKFLLGIADELEIGGAL